jgi:hypothetical protein
MFKSVIAKSITAVTAAALAAGLLVGLTSVAPEAEAKVPVAVELPALLKGAACSSRGWPHYDQGCQFDLRGSEARTVRVIALR